jgi:adenosylcobinamide kinase/adenosylcobinamide-phosphate guanylyltransferase
MGDVTLVLGGIRSGKSAFAERLAGEAGPSVLYVATGQPTDDAMRRRIDIHRARRSKTWTTVEAPMDPATALANLEGRYDAILLDSISSWITNMLFHGREPDGVRLGGREEEEVFKLVDTFTQSARDLSDRAVLVSDEVGLSLVALDSSGRRFQDVLGLTNQRLASQVENVVLIAAGLPLVLKGSVAV